MACWEVLGHGLCFASWPQADNILLLCKFFHLDVPLLRWPWYTPTKMPWCVPNMITVIFPYCDVLSVPLPWCQWCAPTKIPWCASTIMSMICPCHEVHEVPLPWWLWCAPTTIPIMYPYHDMSMICFYYNVHDVSCHDNYAVPLPWCRDMPLPWCPWCTPTMTPVIYPYQDAMM